MNENEKKEKLPCRLSMAQACVQKSSNDEDENDDKQKEKRKLNEPSNFDSGKVHT